MNQYLAALDFDGTVALTFRKSPHGIDVDSAYALAIKQLFGDEGLNIYREIGGHKNKAPTELVHELTGAYSPEMTEKLVAVKLGYLVNEIGTSFPDGSIWPQPTAGFLDFWGLIERMNAGSDIHLSTAIISHGHEAFIKKTFGFWGLSQPDFLVTEDDIRPRKYPEESSRRFKPGELLLALTHKAWMNRTGDYPFNGEPIVQRAMETRQRIVYFGDDPVKDGELARKPGIVFGHFVNGATGITYGDKVLTFGDWRHIADLFENKTDCLREGKPILEMFAHGLDMETLNGYNKERI